MTRNYSFLVLLVVALGCGAAAGFAEFRLYGYRAQSSWLSQRSRAEAETYVSTLSSDYANAQLDTFDRRRLLVVETAHWRRIQLLALVGLVFFGFAAYVMRAVATIHEDFPVEPGAASEPEKAAAHS
jgi:hypothetical protein